MMDGYTEHLGCLGLCIVMDGYIGHLSHSVLRLMYSAGGLYRSIGNVCYFSNWYLTFTSNTATMVHLIFYHSYTDDVFIT